MQGRRAVWGAVGRWVLTACALGLACSALAALWASRHNETEARAAFGQLTTQVAARLAERIQLYEYGLRGARGAVLVAGSEGVNRALFQRYGESRDIDREFPGARGFGFIRRVRPDQMPAFLALARADGKPDFRIVELGPNLGERFVIQYIEPVARNLPAVGLDIASERNRREAALASMRSGRAALTGPITLVQKTGEVLRSVLFLLPIYTPNAPLDTPAQREAACVGWTYAALSLREVLSDEQFGDARFGMALFDVTQAGHREVLYDAPARGGAAPGRLAHALPLDLHGRQWRVELTESLAFRESVPQTDPRLVFGVGLLLTVLCASVLGLLRLGRERQRVAAAQKGELATIVENSADAIIGEGMDGTVLSWNRAAQQLFGFEEAEVLGKPLAPLFLPAARQGEDKDLLERIGRGEVIPPFDTTRLHRDGTEIDVSVTAGAMHGANRQLIGVAKLMRDVRGRKEAERSMQELAASLERQVQERTAALQQARIAAEAASTAKSMFLANMSHEIRTPMNAVIGATYLLDATDLSPDQRDLLNKAQVASRSLLGIINDVLDLAKIEAGELRIEVQPFSPLEVMDDVEQLFANQAAEKGIALNVAGHAELPARLAGDAVRLRQVLVNLVSNAIKFTQQGQVSLSVRCEGGEIGQAGERGDDAARVWLEWTVTDTGIGIEREAIGKLFAPFTQADASTTRRFGGTGLGLSIVHQLVGMMGGAVNVTSELGRGSRFVVSLPFEVLAHAPEPGVTSTHDLNAGWLEGLRILLVDDSDINLEIGRRVLEREGALVRTCINGQEALDSLRADPHVDAVLLDVQMPVMDGYEAARRIRDELGLRTLPVLALTAGALSEERRKAEAAGMDEFLTKPLEPVVLVRTLRKILERAPAHAG